MEFIGNIDSNLNDVEITDYAQGLVIDGTDMVDRATPTLTNIRIRNTSQNQTRISYYAVEMSNVGDFTAVNDTIEGYTLGWKIENQGLQNRATPTLTNIRIRNTSQNQTRTGSVGFEINGDFDPQISRMLIEDFDTGLSYNNQINMERATPTLTNIRIRNTSQNQTRQTQIGIEIDTEQDVIVENNEIDSCLIAIRLSGDNESIMRNNLITQSLTAFEINNSSPYIHHNLMKIGSNDYSSLEAIKLNGAIDPKIFNNNIIRYNTALNSQTAGGIFTNNLVWGSAENHTHLIESSSTVQILHNLMDVSAETNIYTDPLFVDFENDNFNLTASSPCIDAGNPQFIHNAEQDSSISDIGMNYFDHPFLDVGNLAILEDEDTEFEIELSQYLVNVNNHNLEYFIVENDTLIAEFNETTVHVNPLENWFGNHELIIGLEAGTGYRDSVSIPVTLNNVNDIPENLVPFEEITLEEDFDVYQYPTPLDSVFYDPDSDLQYIITSFDSTKIMPEITGMNLILNSKENVNTTQPTQIVVTASEMLATGARLRSQRTRRSRVSLSDTLLVNISPVGDAPVIVAIDSLVFDEDIPFTINISDLYTDPDGDSLTITMLSNENVEFMQQDAQLIFSSSQNWNGSETISLKATDTTDRETERDLLVHVNPVNDAPVIQEAMFQFNEDDSLEVDLSLIVSDIDNSLDELNYELTNGDNVMIEPIADGSWTMVLRTINENWNGTDSIQITVTDLEEQVLRNSRSVNRRASVTQTFEVIVLPVNDPPVLELPAFVEFAEDTSLEFDILNYITDFDSENFEITFSGNDTISVTQTGTDFEFSASENWFGEEIISFEVSDMANRLIDQDEMIVRVTPVNDPPIIQTADFEFNEDDSLVVDLASYVSDIDNTLEELYYTVSTSENISVEPIALNSWTMILRTTEEDWFGSDSIQVTVGDVDIARIRNSRSVRARETVSQTFNVNVLPINDAPELTLPDMVEFNEDESLTYDIAEHLIDVDDTDFVVTFSGNDSIIVSNDGTEFEFSAPENWFGEETITFTIDDQHSRAIVQDEMIVRVNPINDAPVLSLPEMVEYDEDESFIINMANFLTDIDTDLNLIDISFADPVNSEIAQLANQLLFEIIPNENWNGTETLTVTVNDEPFDQITRNTRRNTRDIVTGSFVYSCLPVNDAPEVENLDVIEFNEDESIEIDLHDYVSDVDNDDSDLSLSISGNDMIVITELADEWHYEISSSEIDWNGSEEVMLTINDNVDVTRNSRRRNRAITEHQFTITCLPVNDAPQVDQIIEDIELDEDFADQTIDISNVFIDPENDELSFNVQFDELEISAEITGSELVLTSVMNWNGTTQVTLIADDNNSNMVRNSRSSNNSRLTEEITFNVVVAPVNDAPVINEFYPEESEFEIAQTGTYSFAVVASDIDNTNLLYDWFVNDEDQDSHQPEHNIDFSAVDNGNYQVRVVVTDGEYDVEHIWTVTVDITSGDDIPEIAETKLFANYPNPFNPTTSVRFDLHKKGNVRIEIYNVRGQLVKTLKNEIMEVGAYTVEWNGKSDNGNNATSGVYFIRMQTEGYNSMKKALMLK
jgi:flagellar hook assembly protein FlgD